MVHRSAPHALAWLLRHPTPYNRWDAFFLCLVVAALFLLAFGVSRMAQPYSPGESLPLSLDPVNLPHYLLRTGIRLGLAMGFSLGFSLVFALLAAQYPMLERLLIPLLDVLQSIPILGFLSMAALWWMSLFPGSLIGAEFAAIFAIFTSQAWNMAFSLFQSFRALPQDLLEASAVFQFSGLQRFVRLAWPYAMPSLIWNMMLSMSGGLFFVVAAEAFSVAHQHVRLPGIGSYIALALQREDAWAIGWAIMALLIGITLYDQLLFKPLLAWAGKFHYEEMAGEVQPTSWLLTGLRRTQYLRGVGAWGLRQMEQALAFWARHRPRLRGPAGVPTKRLQRCQTGLDGLLVISALSALGWLLVFIHQHLGWHEAAHVLLLGGYTLLRVVLLIALATLLWIPVGVWVGFRPHWASRLQGLIQFCAAFPANLLFPGMVLLVLRWDLNPDIWLSPLMILGTQWYLLFNVIAGAASVPTELRYAVASLQLTGWCKWKRFVLPALFPSLVTGAITASGGCWNASIVAEYVSWGDTTLQAQGLGSYIAAMTATGDAPRVALGISVMCLFVWGFNRLVWHKLYRLASYTPL